MMNRYTTLIAALAFNLPAIAAAAASEPAKVEVGFTGIELPQGAIMVALFDSEAGYDGEKALRVGMVKVSGNSATLVFEGLPAGRYAIKSFHDINGDGKMGTNPFGMPTEPFAFSNNAVPNMGPARWSAAAFDVTAGNNAQSITIK